MPAQSSRKSFTGKARKCLQKLLKKLSALEESKLVGGGVCTGTLVQHRVRRRDRKNMKWPRDKSPDLSFDTSKLVLSEVKFQDQCQGHIYINSNVY